MNQQANFLKCNQLTKRICRSRSWVYSVINPRSKYFDPQFPKPIRHGGATFWVESEITSWMEQIVQKSRGKSCVSNTTTESAS